MSSSLEAVRGAAQSWHHAAASEAAARQARDAAIRDAAREGERPVDVAQAAGITRQHVNWILRPQRAGLDC
ncbi:hypothetical protein [Ornithinimicrobium cerasi]|uniref:hypothetical protein n=1 Tax=Ornithinimicrobium cerasi TaxID=2248773 RepID=UPI001143B5C9|nr:hypothetical protein [Ornithinimicrobium cerasi]